MGNAKTNFVITSFKIALVIGLYFFAWVDTLSAQCDSNVAVSGDNVTRTAAGTSCNGNVVASWGVEQGTLHVFRNDELISSSSVMNRDPNISCDGEVLVYQGEDSNGVRHVYKNGVLFSNSAGGILGNNQAELSCDGSVVVWAGNSADIFKNGVIISNGGSAGGLNHFEPKVSCDGSVVVWEGLLGPMVSSDPRVIYKNDVNISGPIPNSVNVNVDVSCDGSAVVWSGVASDGTVQILKNGIPVSTGSEIKYQPVVSCDGSTVAWKQTTNGAGSDWEVYKNGVLQGPGGPGPGFGGGNELSLSCDGSTLAWVEDDGNFNTRVIKNGLALTNFLNVASDRNVSVSCDGDVFWSGAGVIFQNSTCCNLSDIELGDLTSNPDGTASLEVTYTGDSPDVTISGGINAFESAQTAYSTIDCSDPCTTAGSVTFTYPNCNMTPEITFSSACGYAPMLSNPSACDNIPTIGEWAMLIMILLNFVFGLCAIRQEEFMNLRFLSEASSTQE